MTAEEAAPARGDERGRLPIDPGRGRHAAARPARGVVVSIVVAWAAISMGFVGALWLFGAKGPALGEGADAWALRDHVAVDSLPGSGVLTRLLILAFPLHWAVVALGSVALFIGLAAWYNLHVDARAGGVQDEVPDGVVGAATGGVGLPTASIGPHGPKI